LYKGAEKKEKKKGEGDRGEKNRPAKRNLVEGKCMGFRGKRVIASTVAATSPGKKLWVEAKGTASVYHKPLEGANGPRGVAKGPMQSGR